MSFTGEMFRLTNERVEKCLNDIRVPNRKQNARNADEAS